MKIYNQAIYTDQFLEEFIGNPLIEALPPVLEPQEVASKLAVYPLFNNKEILLPMHEKQYVVKRLMNLFQPLPTHIDLYYGIDRLIRSGYINRNPLTKEYAKSFHNFEKYTVSSEEYLMQTLSVIGISGIGKSRSIQRIFSLYPQVITHESYKGKALITQQVVFLTIEMPFDGSVKSFLINIMTAIDNLLGTEYIARYSRSTLSTSQLMPIIAQVLKSLNCGVIICEELQHLMNVKRTSSNQILSFLTAFVNIVGVSLIFVSTPKAMPLLSEQLRQSRRNVDIGTVFWDRLKENEEWKLLVQSIWNYQWSNERVQLSSEWISLFYDLTQGIPDFFVKLWMMCQHKLIWNPLQKMTFEFVIKVADELFKFVNPMLKALKANNQKQIIQFEDLYFPAFDELVKNQTYSKPTKIEVVKQLKEQVQVFDEQQEKEQEQKKTTTTQPQKRSIQYVEGDLRRLYKEKGDKTMYELLKENKMVYSFERVLEID